MSFDWETPVICFSVLAALLGSIYLGSTAAFNANDQDNKFQLACVEAGGTLQYEPQAREIVCKK